MLRNTKATATESDWLDPDVDCRAPEIPARRRRWPQMLLAWIWTWMARIGECIFGTCSLVIILSVLATVPILQLLSLGYLLEATGRVARSRSVFRGLIGVRFSARLGAAAIGVLVTLLPIRVASSFWYSSLLLNGEHHARTRMMFFVTVALSVLATFHVAWSLFRGGRFWHFLWPAPVQLWRQLRQGGMYLQASENLERMVHGLRLKRFFVLGLQGFLGALLWLCIPITLMAVANKVDPPEFGGFIGFLGGLLLSVVLVYLPFLQARLPITGRWSSQFEIAAVREQFRRAPFAYLISLSVTLLLAVPLYLLKAELIPREAVWLPSLLFVAFMIPARLLVGWAIGRALSHEADRFWISRWTAWLAMIPIVLSYSVIVYFTQFTSWHGSLSLYEQHAFLVPVPFLGY